jgi:hypothetical protein
MAAERDSVHREALMVTWDAGWRVIRVQAPTRRETSS